MGKFLRDKDGNFVAIDGGLVLEKTLDRKPRDCESCGFSKWVRKDKIFIIQQQLQLQPQPSPQVYHQGVANGGGFDGGGGGGGGGMMEWICPDCALRRGLPLEHYHKNFYSDGKERALQQQYQAEHRGRRATTAADSGNRNGGGGGREDGCFSMWGGMMDLSPFTCHFY